MALRRFGVAVVVAMAVGVSACQPSVVSSVVPSSDETSPAVSSPAVSVSATSEPSPSASTTPTSTPSAVLANAAGASSFPMGMTVAAFYKQAASLGWKCSPASSKDPDATIDVGLTSFSFIDNGLYSITIGDGSFATSKGLRVGDTVETMEKLYGTDYGYQDDMSEPAYTYWFSDGSYMLVTVSAHTITGISLGVQ